MQKQLQNLEYLTKFHILSCIATGGMGEVYLAEQRGCHDFKKTVAIKVIRGDMIFDQETLDMFIGEARLVADLIHENIVQVYHFEQVHGNYYLIMEYAQGPTLEKFMERQKFIIKNIPVDMGAFIISRVARGLAYVHKKRDTEGNRLKIVHRDVSPSNIIITYQGVVKLLDFGIAKAINMKVPNEREVLMGKYPYMSPEQARCEITDFRSDLFSLGLVAYELLTGKKVYEVEDGHNLLQSMQKPIVPPHEINPAIPLALSEIIMKSLSIEISKRFSSAAEMREKLEHFLYDGGLGPTNERLSQYVKLLFPEAKKGKIG
ncbi:MAG: serine/threonine protein kinase [Candidatus Brocadiae bacterium]|nr:serine/threonine protein kinase [Candidatus Brocadiia bacterium]